MKCTPIAAALTLLALSTSLASAQDAERRHSLKAEDRRPGSMIRDTVGWSSRVPLDKSYEELTPEQKAAIRAAYTQLPEDYEPPYPVDGMAPIIRAVSKLMGRMWFEGEMVMHVAVDATGAAKEFKLIKYPNMEAARAVATVIAVTKFKPALCGKQACAMEFPLKLKLELR